MHKIGKGYEVQAGGNFTAESNTKLVFQIDSGIEAFRKQLLVYGVKVGEVKSFKGINSLFCDGQDPEGNVFQIEEKQG